MLCFDKLPKVMKFRLRHDNITKWKVKPVQHSKLPCWNVYIEYWDAKLNCELYWPEQFGLSNINGRCLERATKN